VAVDDEPDRDVDDVDEERRRAAAVAEAERRLLADANEVARDNAMRERGRKIGGAAGAALAGAMIAIRDIYEGPPKDEGSVVVDSPTEPEDVDRDGVALAADEVGGDHDLAVPAQPRRAPIVGRRTSRRR
jgi:hypothetical protein